MSGIQEKLLVAFRAKNRRRDYFGPIPQPLNRFFNAPACLVVQRGVANNPSFAHLMPFQLELGLY